MHLLKLAREVAFIGDAHPVHDLFNAQERGAKQMLGLLHSDQLYVLHHR